MTVIQLALLVTYTPIAVFTAMSLMSRYWEHKFKDLLKEVTYLDIIYAILGLPILLTGLVFSVLFDALLGAVDWVLNSHKSTGKFLKKLNTPIRKRGN